MIRVPRDFRPLIDQLSSATRHRDTARRLILFFAAATLVLGDRTVSSVLRLFSLIEPLNPSTYHRLFSHRQWSAPRFARIIAGFVIDRFCPKGVIRLVGDETVDGHRGKNVSNKARHRDAVRSSHSQMVYRYGHKWVVLAILVDLPYTSRPMALPLLIALYRDRKTNTAEGRKHRTPAELMVSLLSLLMHWFPERKFVLPGTMRTARTRWLGLPIVIAGDYSWSARSCPTRTCSIHRRVGVARRSVAQRSKESHFRLRLKWSHRRSEANESRCVGTVVVGETSR